MKKLLPLATFSLIALSSLLTTPTQAATTSSGFNVTANLTAQCAINTAASALDFGTYTAFGSASIPAPTTSVSFKCTKGTTISGAAFDTVNGTAAGAGVVQGLAYTMAVGSGALVAGTAATSTVGATADVTTYTITGTMVSGQPGAGSGAGTSARTLIISY